MTKSQSPSVASIKLIERMVEIEEKPVSKGMKIYVAALLALVVALLSQCIDPPIVRELNRTLKANPALAAYPYPFRVIDVEAGTAVMGSPRNTQVSVPEVIKAIYPGLSYRNVEDESFLTAQTELASHQALARSLVLLHSDIERVQWRLDKRWLEAHGVVILH